MARVTGVLSEDPDKGSVTFQTDEPYGEPLTLYGPAAQTKKTLLLGAPPPSAPPPPSAAPPPMASGTEPLASEGPMMSPAPPPTPTPKEPDFWQRAQAKVDAAKYSAQHPTLSEKDMQLLADAREGEARKAARRAGLSPVPPAAGPGSAAPAQTDLPPPLLRRPGTGGGPEAGVVYWKGAEGQPQAPPIDPNAMVKLSQSVSSDTTSVNKYTPAELAAQAKADEKTKAAQQAQADAATEKAGQEAELYQGTGAMLAESRQRQEAIEAERRQVMEQRMARLDQLSKEAAAEKIDPNHYWADKTQANKFESALFQGLSALGAGLIGGPAYAVNMVKDSIDRDIAAETNILGQFRQEFGDRAAAESAVRIAKLGEAQEKLKEIGARNLPKEQAANLQAMQAKLESDRLAEIQRLNRRTTTTRTNTQYAPAAALMAQQGQADAWTPEEARVKLPAKNTLDTIAKFGPAAGLVQDPRTGVWTMTPGARAALEVPTSSEKHAYTTLVHALATEAAKLRHGGSPSEAEIKAEKEYFTTISPQEISNEINSLSGTAQTALGTRFTRGKNLVAGGSEGQ